MAAALAMLVGRYSTNGFTKHGTRSGGTALKQYEEQEAARLENLRRPIADYVTSSTMRPLCVAVFGTPGSGKSYGVKQVVSDISKSREFKDKRFPFTTLNLTQISGATELADALSRIAGEQSSKTIPIVFFDEFDTSRNGAPLGWLSWFLSPMYDGEILHAGATVRLQRAIYVFAGGTASTFDEFTSRPKDPAFRAAKGPDFASRIHAYLDVLGPNDEPGRTLRRANILKDALIQRAKSAPFSTTADRVQVVLEVGRFRHGSRSIKTIVESCRVEHKKLFWPDRLLLDLHADRGPLDREAIGGPIVLSGFAHDAGTSRDLGRTLRAVALDLWRSGATLAFGGKQQQKRTDIMNILKEALGGLPASLTTAPSDHKRLIVFGRVAGDGGRSYVARVRTPSRVALSIREKKALGNSVGWVGDVLLEFNKRLTMAELSIARVVFGGATSAKPKKRGRRTIHQRFPGIAEETMLSLALGRPVYIVGAFGGAAQEVGALLGLARPWSGDPLECFTSTPESRLEFEKLRYVEDRLRPPPLSDLPITLDELEQFFRRHAVGSKRWPSNGLSVQENRELFAEKDPERIVALIKKGLFARG